MDLGSHGIPADGHRPHAEGVAPPDERLPRIVGPVKLLRRYSGRFPLMHVKDIRKGEARTFNPGTVTEEASVPLGTGEVSWVPVLEAARKHGVKHYYLEEEHPNTVPQMRQSLRYLERLGF